jgi:hypothetical protein
VDLIFGRILPSKALFRLIYRDRWLFSIFFGTKLNDAKENVGMGFDRGTRFRTRGENRVAGAVQYAELQGFEAGAGRGS